MASHFKRKGSESRICKYRVPDSANLANYSPKLKRSSTSSQILDGNLRNSRMTWIKQIPERIYSRIGSRFRELTFKFNDTKLVQKIFPTHFPLEAPITEANESIEDILIGFDDNTTVQLQVYLLRDSKLGFYHTGLEFRGQEYTFCANVGICQHTPKLCCFAEHLGSVNLGTVTMLEDEFKDILRDMELNEKFSYSDYDVMGRSCNTFTAALSERLGIGSKYPQAIQSQSQLGQILAPVIHAIDAVAEHSGYGNITEVSEAISGQAAEESGSLLQSNQEQGKMKRSNSNDQMSLRSNSSFSSLASTFTKSILKGSSSNLLSSIPFLNPQNTSLSPNYFRSSPIKDDGPIFDDITSITVHRRSSSARRNSRSPTLF